MNIVIGRYMNVYMRHQGMMIYLRTIVARCKLHHWEQISDIEIKFQI